MALENLRSKLWLYRIRIVRRRNHAKGRYFSIYYANIFSKIVWRWRIAEVSCGFTG